MPLRGRNLELLILLLSIDVYCGIARQVRPVITIYCKKLVGREVLGEMEGARGGGERRVTRDPAGQASHRGTIAILLQWYLHATD